MKTVTNSQSSNKPSAFYATTAKQDSATSLGLQSVYYRYPDPSLLMSSLKQTVTLSKGTIGVVLIATVLIVSVAGYWHDQSIKAVYSSLAVERSQIESQYTSQIQQLHSQTKFTLVLGVVLRYGSPDSIFFEDQSGQTLSSAAIYDSSQFRYTYQVYLKSGETYGVSITYSGFLSNGSCAGDPVVITPSGSVYRQDFECRE